MWIKIRELCTVRLWIMWISRSPNKDFVQVVRLTIKLFLCHLRILTFSIQDGGDRGKLIFCEQPGKKLNKFMVSVTMYKIDWKENGREETK